MTYPEAIQWLYDLRLFGAKLGLENPRRLAKLVGNPQDRLRIIHVAGTNGKGSVCAMLESIYRQAGYKTGLFTSPHLISFRERMQINRQLIAEKDIIRLAGEMRTLLHDCPRKTHPTFFEVITVMALQHFAKSKCDVVLLETGLGGRLDATNIVTPIASVITPINEDHQQWLGDTLAKIAAEKAGIIKAGKPIFCAVQKPEAQSVIESVAKERDATLTLADTQMELPALSLHGEHQKQNAALAATVAKSLIGELPAEKAAIREGLANAQWPARAQSWQAGNRRFIFDAAHNPASMRTLVDILRKNHSGQAPAILLGMSQEKNWREMCRLIAPLASLVMAVPTSSQKAVSPGSIAEVCSEFCETMTAESVEQGLDRLTDEPFVVVAGSIYLAGEVMERLNVSPQPEPDERDLNEWIMAT